MKNQILTVVSALALTACADGNLGLGGILGANQDLAIGLAKATTSSKAGNVRAYEISREIAPGDIDLTKCKYEYKNVVIQGGGNEAPSSEEDYAAPSPLIYPAPPANARLTCLIKDTRLKAGTYVVVGPQAYAMDSPISEGVPSHPGDDGPVGPLPQTKPYVFIYNQPHLTEIVARAYLYGGEDEGSAKTLLEKAIVNKVEKEGGIKARFLVHTHLKP